MIKQVAPLAKDLTPLKSNVNRYLTPLDAVTNMRRLAMYDGAKRVGAIADIKATTDASAQAGIADPKRLGIMGLPFPRRSMVTQSLRRPCCAASPPSTAEPHQDTLVCAAWSK